MKKSSNLLIKGLALFFAFSFIFLCSGCYAINAKKYTNLTLKYANEYAIEPSLLMALIYAESSFDASVVSSKGAVGLMQILPSTAVYIATRANYTGNIDLYNPECNLTLGCEYISYLKEKFINEKTLLCAYNAGEGAVLKWLNDKNCSQDGKTLVYVPYPETRNYLIKIEKYKQKYQIYLQKYYEKR
ncbi:MAG: lytic transglycosylase domain-containing protein [Clostridia bacterium]|nr:lytic transglycosylase domain-containing protein [Clostridia bacterium]